MSKHSRARFVALAALLARRQPEVDPSAIAEARVIVDGRIVTNPAAQVRLDASLRVHAPRRLRGDIKLSYALDMIAPRVAGQVALDVDLSYLALRDAIPQLDRVNIAADADLVALVKPTFERHRGRLAATPADLTEATNAVAIAAEHAGWNVVGSRPAPATGRRGAIEAFVHARRNAVPQCGASS